MFPGTHIKLQLKAIRKCLAFHCGTKASCLLCLDLFHIIKILILRQAIMMYKIKSVLATVVRRKPSKIFLILPSLTIFAGDFLTSFFSDFLDGYHQAMRFSSPLISHELFRQTRRL